LNLPEISIRNPVFAWMIMSFLIIFGYVSFTRLGIAQNPDVDYPNVNVSIDYRGATAEVIERELIDTIEGSLVAIAGIRRMTSSAAPGGGDISLEFDLEKDIDIAVQEVQTQLARVQSRLPQDVEPPSVRKSNPNDRPILWMSVNSDSLSDMQLSELVRDRLRDQFTVISGVAEVILGGYSDPAINIEPKLDRLKNLELSIEDLRSTIQRQNLELPAGTIENEKTERQLRFLGEVTDLSDIGRLPVQKRGGSPNYRPTMMSEVTNTEYGLIDKARISRFNGRTAIGIGIRKQRGSNTVEVANRVKERAEEITKILPEGVSLSVSFDSTPFIEESVHELILTLILASLFTGIVCWFFLGNLSSTINVLLAIPTSILGSFIILNAFGFTLNTLTLLALSLAVGVVVDDAIIVLENITRRRQLGEDRVTASLKGSKEIMLAVLATTLSLVAVFLPVAFVRGLIGRFLFEFSVTISVAVLISALEALTLTPMRCSQFMGTSQRTSKFGKAIERWLESLTKSYGSALHWALGRRKIVLLFATLVLAIGGMLALYVPKELAPDVDESRLFLQLKTAPGSSLAWTDGKVKKFEEVLASKEYIDRFYVTVGGFGGGESNTAFSFVTLKEQRHRGAGGLSSKDIADELRKEISNIDGLRGFVRASSSVSFIGGGYGIELAVKGPAWEDLRQISKQLEDAIKSSGKFTDIRRDEVEGLNEVRIIPDRTVARQLGVEAIQISEILQVLYGGARVGDLSYEGKLVDVYMLLPRELRQDTTALEKMRVRNDRGELVDLSRLVKIEEGESIPRITRDNRQRAINISANPTGVTQDEAMKLIREISNDIIKTPNYTAFTGSSELFEESFRELIFTLLLGIVVSYMVLASQFNSFVDPLIALIAVPFSLIGAFIALAGMGQTLNLFSFIGIVLLVGLGLKGSILLVEVIRQLSHSDENLSWQQVIEKGSSQRLRPVLMTAFSTIAAALPGALNWGAGSETRIPMSLVIIGGIFVSTAFVLFVVPCLMSYRKKVAH